MAGQLTKTLTFVQTELNRLLEQLEEVLRSLEGGKAALINSIKAAVSPNEAQQDVEEMIREEDIIQENITRALQEIAQARSWIGRLNNVARNGVDIAKKVEQTWFEAMKNFVQESRWYREHFPLEYEKRQREKEYERYRLRPETFYGKPTADEMERIREISKSHPELLRDLPKMEDIKVRSSLQRVAQVKELDALIEQVEQITKEIMELITTYFSADSPILEASNNIVGKLKSDRARKIDPTLQEALGDEVQALEAMFGFGEYPGKFITSGNRAFLIPAIKSLQAAMQRLSEPVKQVGETAAIREQVQEDVRQQKPPHPITPSPVRKSRREVLLEKLNIIANRKRRCRIIQRIASSREKEEFSNG